MDGRIDKQVAKTLATKSIKSVLFSLLFVVNVLKFYFELDLYLGGV